MMASLHQRSDPGVTTRQEPVPAIRQLHSPACCSPGSFAHLMSTSPRLPANWPSMYSSVLASCSRAPGTCQSFSSQRECCASMPARKQAAPQPGCSPALLASSPAHLQVHVRVHRHQVTCGSKTRHERPIPRAACAADCAARLRWLQRPPLYSMPHLSLTMTGLPVSSLRKGLGLTGTVCGKSPMHQQQPPA